MLRNALIQKPQHYERLKWVEPAVESRHFSYQP